MLNMTVNRNCLKHTRLKLKVYEMLFLTAAFSIWKRSKLEIQFTNIASIKRKYIASYFTTFLLFVYCDQHSWAYKNCYYN